MEQNSLAITMEEACGDTALQEKARKAARRRELAKVKAKKKQDAEAYRKRRICEFTVSGWLPKLYQEEVKKFADLHCRGNIGLLVSVAVISLIRGLKAEPPFVASADDPPVFCQSPAPPAKRRWWAFWRRAA